MKLTMIEKKTLFRPTIVSVSLLKCLARVVGLFQNQVFMAMLE